MSYRGVAGAAIGIGAMGQLAYGQPARWRAFVEDDNQDLVKIEVMTPSGSIIGLLPLDVQNTIVKSFKHKSGDKGGTEFELVLNEDPGFPLVRFTEITVWIGTKRDFHGYIWKYPGPEKKIGDPFVYSGFGMGKRLEKQKIALKLYRNVYQIDSISMAGSDMTVQSTVNLFPEDVVGCVAIVKGAESNASDGRFDIIGAGLDYVTVVNPAGVNQTLDIGTFYILPREWSDPTTKISDLIKQVITEYFGDLPIAQSLDFIEDTPDALTGAVIDLDGMALDDFIEKMRTLLDDWLIYIDEKSCPVLHAKEGLKETLVVGYDAQETDETRDEDSIVNRITVNRKQGKETQRVGFISQAGFAEDADSIAVNGAFEDEVDVPVFWGDALCQAYAEADLARRKEPKITFMVRNMPYRRWPLGNYRFISPPRLTETIISTCQDADEWTFNDELLGLFEDSSTKQFGAGSIRIDYDIAALDEEVILATDVSLADATRLRFWYKGSIYGQRLKVGIGENSITEHTFQIEVHSGKWKPYDIDVSSLGMSRLVKFGFIFDESPSEFDSATFGFLFGVLFEWPWPLSGLLSFYVDQISLVSNAPQDRTFELVEVEKVADDKRVCHLTFGARKEMFDNFMAGQFRSLQSARLALREK